MVTVHIFLNRLRKPYHENLEPLLYGYRTGMAYGDIESATLCILTYTSMYLFCGFTLGPVKEDIPLHKIMIGDNMLKVCTVLIQYQYSQCARVISFSVSKLSAQFEISQFTVERFKFEVFHIFFLIVATLQTSVRCVFNNGHSKHNKLDCNCEGVLIMTVASLWKMLDHAGCGVTVGVQDLMNPNHSRKDLTNPWNYNQTNRESSSKKRPVLAVDLSIWICEGLTSQAMAASHKNPALQLAYTRSMKLLGLGIKLVIVVEGKRRVRRTEEPDTFSKRRSGTAFWKACKACEQMFECMGVPVVKAKAEGEALCALLSQRGIVDGVISNDGDCLLFGAKVVYTKFSIENLQNSQVVRYDSSDLAAVVDNEGDENREDTDGGKISLSRHDLISFALLTGSDMAGNGLPKVGHKKAVRFLYKCKHDHPLSTKTAAIDELRSWARTALVVHASGCDNTAGLKENRERCCSVCNHPGDKRSHLKNGCETCGTEAGEPCFQFTGSDRFRQSLRAKALAIQPKFAPTMVVDAYLKPNDNSIPLLLEGQSSATLEMRMPSLSAFLALNLIVKGQSHATSREFVMETLSRLLVRRDLFGDMKKGGTESGKRALSKEVPVPTEITRQLVRDKSQCFEVSWRVQATVTDSDGNDVDGYEFSTVESQELIKKRYPSLVSSFCDDEVERQKQGDAERVKRKEFIETFLHMNADGDDQREDDEGKHARKRGGKKKRNQEGFFEGQRAKRDPQKRARVEVRETDEMKALMRPLGGPKRSTSGDYDYSTIASGSVVFRIGEDAVNKKKQYGRPKVRLHDVQPLGMMITVFKPSTHQKSRKQQPEDDHFSVVITERPARHGEQFETSLVQQQVSEASAVDLERHVREDHVLIAKPTRERQIVRSLFGALARSEGDEECLETEERQEQVPRSNAMAPDTHSKGEIKHLGTKTSTHQIAADRQGGIKSIEHLLAPGEKVAVPDLSEETNREPEEVGTPVRSKLQCRPDPDSWMAKVVDDDTARMGSDANVSRRLEFDDLDQIPVACDYVKMPTLTPGRRHLIVCDMGIPIQVSPLVSRKFN